MGRQVQVQEEIEGTTTELSQICDEVLEARQAVKEAVASQQDVEERFVTMMNDHGKKSVKHGGRVLRVAHTDAMDKVQVQNAS